MIEREMKEDMWESEVHMNKGVSSGVQRKVKKARKLAFEPKAQKLQLKQTTSDRGESE
jgi:hypothetical protein